MFENKYSKVLTIILVIVLFAILGLLGFLAYDMIQKNSVESEAEAFVSEFESGATDSTDSDKEESNSTENENQTNPLDQIEQTTTNGNSGGNSATKTYKGFNVIGTIKIPAINIEYPVLDKVTKKSIETSVAKLYSSGEGINKVGNTVIIGHNYRNGIFFSNVKNLKINDKIYITDNSGNRITYTIYNKFETTPEDTSFYQRDTNNKPEITLSTCNDDSSKRIIIFAKTE